MARPRCRKEQLTWSRSKHPPARAVSSVPRMNFFGTRPRATASSCRRSAIKADASPARGASSTGKWINRKPYLSCRKIANPATCSSARRSRSLRFASAPTSNGKCEDTASASASPPPTHDDWHRNYGGLALGRPLRPTATVAAMFVAARLPCGTNLPVRAGPLRLILAPANHAAIASKYSSGGVHTSIKL